MSRRKTTGYSEIAVGSGVTPEAAEFGRAIDRLKRNGEYPYPTARDVLAVAHALGYRKVAAPTLKAARGDARD